MATRALIGYLDEDRNFTCTYNHYDGYPDHLGKALLDHYDSDEKAKEIARSFMKGKDTDKKLTKKQKEARKKRGIAKLKDFASTKHKNLPEVLESKVYNFEEYMQLKREF